MSEQAGLFPEGMEEAIRALLKVMSASPNSYRIEIVRYEGEAEYRAEIGINAITSIWPVDP